VMAHVQKIEFILRRNGRIHLNRCGCQFSRPLAAGESPSVAVMLNTPRSQVV
jgi:hypothetical protein